MSPWVVESHASARRLNVRLQRPTAGYGEWIDDSFRGEKLHGYFYDGVPIAPFRSREFGSGHAFVCMRIAYVANHADPFESSTVRVLRLQPARALRLGSGRRVRGLR